MDEMINTPADSLRIIRAVVSGACAAVIIVGTLGSGAGAATESAVDAGDVVIVDAGDPTRELSSGDGNTAFVPRLSGDSVCPGDSVHDQWRVQSFIVPSGDDLATLSYGVIGPEGKDQFALYGADSAASSYANVLTAPNDEAGQPGRIQGLPPFSFAVVAGERVAPGLYHVGLACTLFGSTAKYWQVEVVVSGPATGSPDQLSWRLATAPAPAANNSTNAPVYFWLVGAVALVALVVGLSVRRRTHSTSRYSSKEQ